MWSGSRPNVAWTQMCPERGHPSLPPSLPPSSHTSCVNLLPSHPLRYCGVCTLANKRGAASCTMCGAAPPRVPYVIPEGHGHSVYLCARSLEAALHNCAVCAAAACDVIRRGGTVRGFGEGAERAATGAGALGAGAAGAGAAAVPSALVLARPPGHHASSEAYGSYCLLNSVAVTARTLLDEGLARRLLIIDWDVHHGDGTQACGGERDSQHGGD